MNEDGDYEVAKDEDDVVDLWNENVGGLSRRLVRLRVTMSAPAVTDADVNVPEEAGQAVNVRDRLAVLSLTLVGSSGGGARRSKSPSRSSY
jgi:hypothetical protein